MTFRVFVSSTFSDLKAERNALHDDVFPRLRRYCQQHGYRFQAIDLRWGVSEEAARDQQAMNICLEELRRCQRTTPRPNFVVLLGQRYGRCPIPAQLPADEFASIRDRTAHVDDRALLEEWYRRDDNAVPPEYILRPRQREEDESAWPHEDLRREAEARDWGAIEHRLRAVLTAGVSSLAWPADDERRFKYEASATHQEILYGALQVEDAASHVFGFFRTVQGLPKDGDVGEYLDLDPQGRPDAAAGRRLQRLKADLHTQLQDNILTYSANWTGTGPSTDHIAQLCDDVYRQLQSVISQEIRRRERLGPVEREALAHHAFGQERARVFLGRRDLLRHIRQYVDGSERYSLVVYGASGSGKSALLARAVTELAERPGPPSDSDVDPDGGRPTTERQLIVRYLGTTPASSDIRSLLEGLCKEITLRYGGEAATVPIEYAKLAAEFAVRLELATAQKPLVLFLDALDQLSDVNQGRRLSWLPTRLPEHVRIVVSTLQVGDRRLQPGRATDDCLGILRRRLPAEQFLEVTPLTVREGAAVLDIWLHEAGRTLQPAQRGELMSRFRACPYPLYLRLAFEELRRRKSWEAEAGVKGDVAGVLASLFDRLEQPQQHGRLLPGRTLGYLATSRHGLTEDELLDLLSLDVEVMADFRRRSPRSPASDRLPVVIWARLLADIEPYLTQREVDGATTFVFYHRQVGAVAAIRYLPEQEQGRFHQALAEYFQGQADPNGDRNWDAEAVRPFLELPFHLARSSIQHLVTLLLEFRWLQAKITRLLVVELTQDLREGLATVRMIRGDDAQESDDEISALQSVQRLLSQNAADLAEHPDLLATLVHGYFASTQHPALARLLSDSRHLRGGTWLCPSLPTLGSADGPHLRTLVLGTLPVRALRIAETAAGPCVAAANDEIAAWDCESGERLFPPAGAPGRYTWSVATLEGEDGEQLMLTGDDDGRVRVRSLEQGVEVQPELWDTDASRNVFPVLHLSALRSPAHGGILLSTERGQIWKIPDQRVVGSGPAYTKGVLINAAGLGVVLVGMKYSHAFALSVDGSPVLRQRGHGSPGDRAQRRPVEEPVRAVSAGVLTSRDGRPFVAVAEGNGIVRAFDAITDDEVFRSPDLGSEGDVAGCLDTCLLSDGSSVLVAGFDSGAVRIWDVDSGRLLQEFNHDNEPILSVSVHCRRDGSLLLATGGIAQIHLFEPMRGLGVDQLRTAGLAEAVAMRSPSPGVCEIAVAEQAGPIKVFDGATGRLRSTYPRGERVGLTTLQYWTESGGDDPLLLAADLERLEFWSDRGGLRTSIRSGADFFMSFCPYREPETDRSVACLGRRSGRLDFYYFSGEPARPFFEAHREAVTCVAAVSDPQTRHDLLITGSTDGTVRVLDLHSLTDIIPPLVHTEAVFRIAVRQLDASGQILLAATCLDGTVQLWDVRSGERYCPPQFQATPALGVAILEDASGGPRVLTVASGGCAYLWDDRGGLLQSIPFSGQTISCSADSGSSTCAVLETIGRAHVFSLVGQNGGPGRKDSADGAPDAVKLVYRTWARPHHVDDDTRAAAHRIGEQYFESIQGAVTDPLGDVLVTCGTSSPVVRLWKNELRSIGEVKAPSNSPVSSVAVCDWRDHVITFSGQQDGTLTAFDSEASTLRVLRRPDAGPAEMRGIAVIRHQDNEPLVVASCDTSGAWIHEIADVTLERAQARRLRIDLTSYHRLAHERGMVRTLRSTEPRSPGPRRRFTALALGRNPATAARALVLGMDDGSVLLHDCERDEPCAFLRLPDRRSIRSLAVGLHPRTCHQAIAVLDEAGELSLWEPAAGRQTLIVLSSSEPPCSVAVIKHPCTGEMVLAIGAGRSLQLRDLSTWEEIGRWDFDDVLTVVAAGRSAIWVGDAAGRLHQLEMTRAERDERYRRSRQPLVKAPTDLQGATLGRSHPLVHARSAPLAGDIPCLEVEAEGQCVDRDDWTSMAESPCPRQFASASYDGTVSVWDITTSRRVGRLGETEAPRYRSVSAGQLGLRGVPSGYSLPARDLTDHHYPAAISYLPAEDVLLSGWNDGFSVWDTLTDEHAFAPHFREDVRVVAPSPDGSICMSGTRSGELFLWDIRDWRQEIRLLSRRKSQQGTFHSCVWPGGSRWLVTTGVWTALEIWDLSVEDGSVVVRFPEGVRDGNDGSLTRVVRTPRPDVVAVSRYYAVAQFGMPSGELLSVWEHPTSVITDLCRLPNPLGRSLVVLGLKSVDGFIVLDLLEGRVLVEQGTTSPVCQVAASRDGCHIVTSSAGTKGASAWKVSWRPSLTRQGPTVTAAE